MEPEIHIVEKWLQLVHRCFTVTNIRAKGNKEIDILAINPRKDARVHVECSCKVGRMLDVRKKFTHNGKTYSNELDYFSREKFEHPSVLQRVKEFFGEKKYTRTLVVWDARKVIPGYGYTSDFAAARYDMEIKPLGDLIHDLRAVIEEEHRGHRDDILRLIELIVAEEETWKKEMNQMKRDAERTIRKQERSQKKTLPKFRRM